MLLAPQTRRRTLWIVAVASLCLSACASLERFSHPSPHERYADGLDRAGLGDTALARDWRAAATAALDAPAAVTTPFTETGYAGPGHATAVAYQLMLPRGRRLVLDVAMESLEPTRLFVNLFERRDAGALRRVASLGDGETSLEYEVPRDGTYVVRVQPELLRSGRFTVTQRTTATLRYPLDGGQTRVAQSLFGAARDAGRRQHEGVDLFAPRGTPVLAVANGLARTDTNPLGGNVVWLANPRGYRFYYAHLDDWAITGSTLVRTGDTLGFVGNTGNARTTAPHLHFGIYAEGAVDPWPFLQSDDPSPSPPEPGTVRVGQLARVVPRRVTLRHSWIATPSVDAAPLARDTPLEVIGATDRWMRVRTPSLATGYVPSSALTAAEIPLRVSPVSGPLIERPVPGAPLVARLEPAAEASLLGRVDGYELLQLSDGRRGWRVVPERPIR